MTERHNIIARLAWSALGLALIAAVAEAFAGFGTKWALWDFRTGFTILRWSAWSGLVIAGIALILAGITLRGTARRGFTVALAALFVGGITFSVPWLNQRQARSVPPIHDITTDTENPPMFQDALPLRKDARNPPEYAGVAVAKQQKEAYPDIAPLLTKMPPNATYRAALNTAVERGWRISGKSGPEGRIEAVETTFWFGFKDDIVIRIAPADGGGSRIDVRSKSRVGRSDVGANAARIRAYINALKKNLAAS